MPTASLPAFTLDDRLARDTLPAAMLENAHLRLMDDRRWPWLVLVPQIQGASEIHMLEPEAAQRLNRQTLNCARALAQVTGCDKINTGAIGNIVRQLHVHVVARFEGDTNWPGTVWGHAGRVSWPKAEAEELIARIKAQLAGLGEPCN